MTVPQPGITPRLLSEQQAAAYLGRSASRFREQVAARILPQPVTKNGNRRLWDVRLLDRYVDQLSGINDNSGSWDGL